MQTPKHPYAHRPLPRVLVALTALIALVELALTLADMGLFGASALRLRAFSLGAFWSPLLRGGEPIFGFQPATMFVSHAFLHGGLLHMAMNMTILLAMGRLVADNYGARAILPIFLAGAVAGGAMFGILSDEAIPMVGASGAVFAFLGVWVVWDWARHRRAGAPVAPVATRVAVLAGLNLVFFFALDGLLAWEAHLGGFLAGLACGVYLEQRRQAHYDGSNWREPRE